VAPHRAGSSPALGTRNQGISQHEVNPFFIEKSMVSHGERSRVKGESAGFWIVLDFHRNIFKLSGQDGGEKGSPMNFPNQKRVCEEVWIGGGKRKSVTPPLFTGVIHRKVWPNQLNRRWGDDGVGS